MLASFGFLGRAWCDALAEAAPLEAAALAVAPARRSAGTKWSDLICFAGLAAGEVTLGGRKVVGLSQRRDRGGAWFHSMALLHLDPVELPGLLDLDGAEQAEAAAVLGEAATAVPGGRSVAPALLAALLGRLSSPG